MGWIDARGRCPSMQYRKLRIACVPRGREEELRGWCQRVGSEGGILMYISRATITYLVDTGTYDLGGFT